jgi:hypothetical protein
LAKLPGEIAAAISGQVESAAKNVRRTAIPQPNRPWHSRGAGLSSRGDEGRFNGRAPVNDKHKKELKNDIAQG